MAALLLIKQTKKQFMAQKRRSHRRKSHRRRVARPVARRRRHRRIGAMALSPTSTMVQAGTVVAGYLLAGKINPLVDKLTGTMDAKIVSAIQVGLGGALVLGKLGKRSMVTVIPGGLIAGAGIKRALTSFGVVTGYGSVDVISGRMVKGYQKVPAVSGYNPQASLNGYPTASVPINGPNVSARIMGKVGQNDGLISKDLVG
jgi:hypothetical protein